MIFDLTWAQSSLLFLQIQFLRFPQNSNNNNNIVTIPSHIPSSHVLIAKFCIFWIHRMWNTGHENFQSPSLNCRASSYGQSLNANFWVIALMSAQQQHPHYRQIRQIYMYGHFYWFASWMEAPPVWTWFDEFPLKMDILSFDASWIHFERVSSLLIITRSTRMPHPLTKYRWTYVYYELKPPLFILDFTRNLVKKD